MIGNKKNGPKTAAARSRLHSIRTKIILIIFIFLLMNFALMITINAVSGDAISTAAIKTEIENIAVNIRQIAEKYLMTNMDLTHLETEFPYLFDSETYTVIIVKNSDIDNEFLSRSAFRSLASKTDGSIVSTGFKKYYVLVRVLSTDPAFTDGSGGQSGADTYHLVIARQLPLFSEVARQTIKLSVLGFIISVIPALILLFIVLKKFTTPIENMSLFADEIANSNFEAKLDIESNDEIGQLGASLNEMAGRLRQNEKERDLFLAGISHELRTPLTTIKANTSGIIDGIIDRHEINDYLLSNIEEIDRLTLMVNDLIMLSSFENDTRILSEEVDLSIVLQSVADQMGLLADKKGISLDCNLERPLICQGDKLKLKQVFINILDNAIRHTGESGRITITAKKEEDGRIRIIFTDTGDGLSDDVIRNLFVRFYRGKDREGLGLGLYIAKIIVNAHDGELSAFNNPDKGASFEIVLG
ncbi:MAG: sensor histidine kinase [Saccharofermentanales bacterium]